MSIKKSPVEKAHSNKVVLKLIIVCVGILFLWPAAVYVPMVIDALFVAIIALLLYVIVWKKGGKNGNLE